MVCSFLVLVLQGGFELCTPLGSVFRRSVSHLSLSTPLPFVLLLPAAYELTENAQFSLLRKLVNALLGRLTAAAHRSAICPQVLIYAPGTLATGVSSRNRTLAALSYHPCLLPPKPLPLSTTSCSSRALACRARPTARQASYSWFPSAGSRVTSGSSTYLVCHPVYQLITHGPIVHFPAIHLRSYLVRIPILQSWFKYPLPCPFVSPPSPPFQHTLPPIDLVFWRSKGLFSCRCPLHTRFNLRDEDILEALLPSSVANHIWPSGIATPPASSPPCFSQ
ncbi:hypothetical protein DER45DRAFT_278601 [Fusarium avenaceum]|nr:hypothetical protein DER45DRAFT_278601 [Fusarium avenaceum]